MSCNCNNIQITDTIQFIVGTTVIINIVFETDISSYTTGHFTIRKNYDVEPVLNKTVSLTEPYSATIKLDVADSSLFTEFERNKNSAQYIWGFDVEDSDGNVINVFPQVGSPAPLCIVQKHVVEDEE